MPSRRQPQAFCKIGAFPFLSIDRMSSTTQMLGGWTPTPRLRPSFLHHGCLLLSESMHPRCWHDTSSSSIVARRQVFAIIGCRPNGPSVCLERLGFSDPDDHLKGSCQVLEFYIGHWTGHSAPETAQVHRARMTSTVSRRLLTWI